MEKKLRGFLIYGSWQSMEKLDRYPIRHYLKSYKIIWTLNTKWRWSRPEEEVKWSRLEEQVKIVTQQQSRRGRGKRRSKSGNQLWGKQCNGEEKPTAKSSASSWGQNEHKKTSRMLSSTAKQRCFCNPSITSSWCRAKRSLSKQAAYHQMRETSRMVGGEFGCRRRYSNLTEKGLTYR